MSHSKRRTPRIFKPNLHVARVEVEGRMVKKKLCTKCLRMFKKVAAVAFKQEVSSTTPAS